MEPPLAQSVLNKRLNERETAEGRVVLESLPLSLDVTLTTACNLIPSSTIATSVGR